MRVSEREPGDVAELARRARSGQNALQRDRYRAVLMALGREALEIARVLGRSRRGVQDWVYAYRDGGMADPLPGKWPGRPTKLPRDREAELMRRLDAGPQPHDAICTLRGRDVVRILQQEFGGVRYSLDGAYDLLERLGYSRLAPRPLHEKSDPRQVERFKEFPPFVDLMRGVIAPYAGRLRVWFMDEARSGQQGTLTDVWARTGSRARGRCRRPATTGSTSTRRSSRGRASRRR